MKEKISVVINTYNSECFLERVLESVRLFDEVVICDMYSTDRTLEIAHSYSCQVVFHEKCDVVEPSRNFAIQSATHDWVLVVDSDEVVPDALRIYLYDLIEKKSDLHGLWLTRKNYLMGRFLHGDYPDYILRFFRKANVFWPPFVHVVPQVEGLVSRAPRNRKDLSLIHLINNTLELKLRKINIYTNEEVVKRSGKRLSKWNMFTAPFFRFFKSYILKGGFKDGRAGIVIAGMDAFYKFVTIAKIWESEVRAEDVDQDLKG